MGAPALYVIEFVFSCFIAEILIVLLFTAMIHFLAAMLGGTGIFGTIYKVFTYSMDPFQLLKLAHFVGVFGIFYSLSLMVIGFIKLKTLSK